MFKEVNSTRLWSGFTEDRTGSITRCNHCPSVDHSDLVSSSSVDVGGPSCSPTMLPSATDAANQPSIAAPPTQQVKVNGMQVVRDSLRARGVPEKASTVILKSWRGSTQKQYQVYLQKRYHFCSKRGFDPCSVPPMKALDFSAELFEQGLGYSTLNTARSALSQVLPPEAGVSFGDLPLIRQFMKGVFQEKPSLPRYTVTWDPALLLNFLKSQSPIEKLYLKMLTFKTVTLLTLLSVQRIQTIHLLDLRNVDLSESIVKISVGDKTRPGQVITFMSLSFQPTPLTKTFVQFLLFRSICRGQSLFGVRLPTYLSVL
ncbi:uncharacterized protein [Montipora foliosa]|uniref:uncharacterized protein isoform X2 n=1 Tax=Montipora foliosa TaxID=591990 RepID=UPI0035F1336C